MTETLTRITIPHQSPRERAPSNPENPSSSPAQEEEGEEVPVARGSPLHGLINGIFYC